MKAAKKERNERDAMPSKLPLIGTVFAVFVAFTHSDLLVAGCNTRGGYVDNQPTSPVDVKDAIYDAEASASASIENGKFDNQTILIDLSKDIDSLDEVRGRYTQGAPLLGVEWENLIGFDPKKHCNILHPVVYKPKIEKISDTVVRASVDKGRFTFDFDKKKPYPALVRDSDPSGRFFWIVPAHFGRYRDGRPWKLTSSYDSRFRDGEIGSDKKRWVAEAYLNLMMRYYLQSALASNFPTGWQPSRADLERAFEDRFGTNCSSVTLPDLACLASRVIQENEAPPPGKLISKDAFRVGDALLANSGVSAGIRQLDFSTDNEQATRLAPVLMPTTIGKYHRGVGYRRPIRAWDIDTINRWYTVDGATANEELSKESAKQALLQSHAEFIELAVEKWTARLSKAFPSWQQPERDALALFAIDLENVSGFEMQLRRRDKALCDVLQDTTIGASRRSNWAVVSDQAARAKRVVHLLGPYPSMSSVDFSCVESI